MPTLVDTHCHLDWEPLASQVDAVLTRARAAGVARCVTIGTTLTRSQANVEIARRHSMVRAAVGIHPNDAETATDDALAALDTLSADPTVAAIGEIGLDFYRTSATPQRQDAVLRALLRLAIRRDLPVLIHCRDAHEACLTVLRQEAGSRLRGIMHCASGPPAFIQGALALNFSISFAGNVTFPNAEALRALVPLVPDDRLLIETDAPFLAPQAVRGRMNEPAHVAHTAEALARLRGVSIEELGRTTTANACQLFRWTDLETC